MKKIIVLFVILSIYSSCNHKSMGSYDNAFTKKDYSLKYKSFLKPSEKELSSTYNVLTSFDNQSNKYIKRVFIPEDKTLISYEEYADGGLRTLDGMQRIYYPNGNLSKETPYVNGQRFGEGFEYYINAKNATRSKGKYENNVKHGEWENFSKEGRSKSLYTYIEGDRHGPYAIYNEDGATKVKGMYIRGKLSKQDILIGETQKAEDGTVYKVVEQMPHFPGCESEQDSLERHKCQQMEMLKYVYGNIKYPAIDRQNGMQGLNVVQFVVDKTGHIRDVQSIKAVTRAMERASIDIVRKMPKWHPGIQNDKPVDVLFTLPVKFKLE